MGKGLDFLVTPYSTTEFQAMAEAARQHHHAAYDQYHVMAVELRRGLSRVQGAKGLLGIDVRIAARRVSRHITHAASLQLESGRAVIRSFHVYQEHFLGKPGNPPASTFQIDK
jgi:hypothetical protein